MGKTIMIKKTPLYNVVKVDFTVFPSPEEIVYSSTSRDDAFDIANRLRKESLYDLGTQYMVKRAWSA